MQKYTMRVNWCHGSGLLYVGSQKFIFQTRYWKPSLKEIFKKCMNYIDLEGGEEQ